MNVTIIQFSKTSTMKTFTTILIILSIIFSINAQNTDTITKELCKNFPEGTELSIAVIHEGRTDYFGFEKGEDDFVSKDNKNSIFEIGSISKVFTSSLLAYMISEGKVKADDPIKKHMKYKLKGNPKITLQQLSNHTSGLPRLPENIMPLLRKNPLNPYKEYNEELFTEYLKKEVQVKKEPGTEYEYSNLGAGLLGKILSDKMQSTYEEALQQYIFGPLKMKNTSTERKKVSDNLVSGKDPIGMDTQNWDFDVLAPAGAVLSSVSDLQKFVTANLDGKDKALNLQQQSTFTVNENMDMAMAWHLLKKDGKSLLFHNGKTGGYTSAMLLDTDGKKAVIILSNLSAFHPKGNNIDVLAFKLMEMLEKEEK
jgi:CubicO group peptidase (beta-lactamase class C family)